MIKCSLCKQEIIGTDYKKRGRGRYHNSCYEKLILNAEDSNKKKATSIKNREKESLNKYICTLFNIIEIPFIISKQIEDYIDQLHYTYSEIEKTLKYFYEISSNDIENYTMTIGIVPYIHDEAIEFFEGLKLTNENNKKFIIHEVNSNVKIKPQNRNIENDSKMLLLDKEGGK